MEKFILKLKELEREYGSLPFWSFNDRLEAERLKNQMRDMKRLGMGGFFMHAREGLETEYLSEEWFKCIKECVCEAKKLGMKAWVYDENGWPSGFAGGKLLENEECHAVYLSAKHTSNYPDDAYATYYLDGDTPIFTDKNMGIREYLAIYLMKDKTYVDTLRGDVTQKFIAETHERYKQLLGNDFGDTMPGFFTDEPQYYRNGMPFSNELPEKFKNKYGYSIKQAIPALYCEFDGARALRYDYWSLVNESFIEGYIKTIYDWCEQNGAMVTGHCIEEVSLYWQMLFCGGIMPFYEYQHIPGIDHLTRRLRTVLPAKQVGSVSAQLKKGKALSEMYAAVGWDTTPVELKRIAEMQYACGVTVMCQHLYPYSERGTRKRDYPLHFSEHNSWQKHLVDFDTYFARLGAVLSLGDEDVDVLVIHPIHSAYLDYTDMARLAGEASLGALDTDFLSLYTALSDNQIPYHLGDESIMRRHASVRDGALYVGACKYGTVIIPAMDQLDKSTAELLAEFSKAGGKIYTYLSHKPTLVSGRTPKENELEFLCRCEDIASEADVARLRDIQGVSLEGFNGDVAVMVRNTEYGKLIFMANKSEKAHLNVCVNINGCNFFEQLMLDSLCFEAVRGEKTDNGCKLLLDFDGGESYVLCQRWQDTYIPMCKTEGKAYISLDKRAYLCKRVENKLTLDRACVSLDGEGFSEEMPIERIRDELLHGRYEGDVYLKFNFYVKEIPNKLSAVIERNGVECIFVNGSRLLLGNEYAIEPAFSLTDISGLVKDGENSLTVKLNYYQRAYVYDVILGDAMETLRNSLSFDSEIEAVTLIGEFCVDADKAPSVSSGNMVTYPMGTRFCISSQRNTVNINNIVEDGYPFFAGEMRVMQALRYPNGAPTALRLDGRFAVCEVSVNGKYVGKLFFEREKELSEYLLEGDNTLELNVCFGNRNLLGPHHCTEAEPMGVGTRNFDFEGQWKNGKCQDFFEGYHFVKSGLI